jgi:hypothetical protein
MRNVSWYPHGASLKQEEGGVAISPVGDAILATLHGPANTHGELDPFKCFVSAAGDSRSERRFERCHLLGQGATTFGCLGEQEGSLTCLEGSAKVDTEAKVIYGAHTRAIDYVEYGPTNSRFLPEYSLR